MEAIDLDSIVAKAVTEYRRQEAVATKVGANAETERIRGALEKAETRESELLQELVQSVEKRVEILETRVDELAKSRR